MTMESGKTAIRATRFFIILLTLPDSIRLVKQFLQTARLRRKPGSLRRRHLDRRVFAAEVVERKEQRHRRFVVLPFLAVRIRQASQPANLHAKRLVGPFNVACANTIFIGVAQTWSSNNVEYRCGRSNAK